MRTMFPIALAALLFAAGSAAAQAPCLDLCAVLPNCGFQDGFAHWACTRPNSNYKCPPASGPQLNVPGAIIPGPDGPFVGVLNPRDLDVAGKLVHDAEPLPWASDGTCFEVMVWANRGRFPNPPIVFTGARSQVLVRFLGWTYGDRPTIFPKTDDWSRRPDALSCSFVFPFPAVGSEGLWLSQVLRCTATHEVEWISLSIAGVNHSHGTYAAFDITPADFVP
jgi:hypothetical protein